MKNFSDQKEIVIKGDYIFLKKYREQIPIQDLILVKENYVLNHHGILEHIVDNNFYKLTNDSTYLVEDSKYFSKDIPILHIFEVFKFQIIGNNLSKVSVNTYSSLENKWKYPPKYELEQVYISIINAHRIEGDDQNA